MLYKNKLKHNTLEMNRIKEILKKQGRTQTWLSEKIEKSYVVVINYCNNNSQPSIEILRKLTELEILVKNI